MFKIERIDVKIEGIDVNSESIWGGGGEGRGRELVNTFEVQEVFTIHPHLGLV